MPKHPRGCVWYAYLPPTVRVAQAIRNVPITLIALESAIFRSGSHLCDVSMKGKADSMIERLRIAVVDDHPLFRAGVTSTLSEA